MLIKHVIKICNWNDIEKGLDDSDDDKKDTKKPEEKKVAAKFAGEDEVDPEEIER